VTARREDTVLLDLFRRWIVKHIESWVAFTEDLGFGVDMEDIVLVTGFHRTKSWSNIALAGVETDTRLSLGVEVTGALGANINWRASNVSTHGAVQNEGPSGEVRGTPSQPQAENDSAYWDALTCVLRAYPITNAYFSEDIVSSVCTGYCRGSEEQQNPNQVHAVGMTAGTKTSFRYQVLILR